MYCAYRHRHPAEPPNARAGFAVTRVSVHPQRSSARAHSPPSAGQRGPDGPRHAPTVAHRDAVQREKARSAPGGSASPGAHRSPRLSSLLQDEILLTPWRDYPVEDADPFAPPVSVAPSAPTERPAQLREGRGAVPRQRLPQFPHPHRAARPQFPGALYRVLVKVQTSERPELRESAAPMTSPAFSVGRMKRSGISSW